MGLTYFKRFRMEIDLDRRLPEAVAPAGYRLLAWDSRLLVPHALAKYLSFRTEIDANVFPCLGDYDGCVRLMQEIARKDGFLPGATWLAVAEGNARGDGSLVDRVYADDVSDDEGVFYCGTVQGIRDRTQYGAIQNLGIVPEQRARGLGSCLLLKALEGFQRAGLHRAFLEVTAQNEGAIRLYRRLGFYKARTVYKAVEMTACAAR